MITGNQHEAFKDLSKGVHVNYKLCKSQPDLWVVMNRPFQCNTLIGCGTFTGLNHINIFHIVRQRLITSLTINRNLFVQGEKKIVL